MSYFDEVKRRTAALTTHIMARLPGASSAPSDPGDYMLYDDTGKPSRISGPLIIASGDPTEDLHAATKGWVDDQVAAAGRGPLISRFVANSLAEGIVLTGTTATTGMASFTLPGNTLGINDRLEFDAIAVCTPNANSKRLRLLCNDGATALSVGSYQWTTVTTGLVSMRWHVDMAGSLTNQLCANFNIAGAGETIQNAGFFSLNTQNDIACTIQGTLGNSADSLTLLSWTARVARF